VISSCYQLESISNLPILNYLDVDECHSLTTVNQVALLNHVRVTRCVLYEVVGCPELDIAEFLNSSAITHLPVIHKVNRLFLSNLPNLTSVDHVCGYNEVYLRAIEYHLFYHTQLFNAHKINIMDDELYNIDMYVSPNTKIVHFSRCQFDEAFIQQFKNVEELNFTMCDIIQFPIDSTTKRITFNTCFPVFSSIILPISLIELTFDNTYFKRNRGDTNHIKFGNLPDLKRLRLESRACVGTAIVDTLVNLPSLNVLEHKLTKCPKLVNVNSRCTVIQIE
jgi:hypothetical protein